MPEAPKFGAELSSLKIDRSQREPENKGWAKWWIIAGVLLFVGFGVWRFAFSGGAAPEVSVVRVSAPSADSLANEVALDAAGYIVAHHKIEVASSSALAFAKLKAIWPRSKRVWPSSKPALAHKRSSAPRRILKKREPIVSASS